jgi:hypothetical protein
MIQARRAGTLTDGYCAKTCEVCSPNPLSLGQALEICGACQAHKFVAGGSSSSTCSSIASLYGIQLSDVRVLPDPDDFVYDPEAPVATLCSDPLEAGSLIAVCNLPMFSRLPAVDVVSGTLTFAPAPNANGFARFRVTLVDDNGTPDQSIDDGISNPVFVSITIAAVNDDPFFTSVGNQAFLVGGVEATVTVRPWATFVSPGAPDEIETEVDLGFVVDVVGAGEALFTGLPEVDVGGSLVFTPDPTTFGSATVEVTLTSGGASSATKTMRIQMIPTEGDNAGVGVGIGTKTVEANSGPGFVVNWMREVLDGALADLHHDRADLYFQTEIKQGGREDCFVHDVRYDVYSDSCANLAIKFFGSALPSEMARITHSEDGRACGAADPHNQFGDAEGLDLGMKLTLCGTCVEYVVDASSATDGGLTCARIAALHGVGEDSVRVFSTTAAGNLVRQPCTEQRRVDYTALVQAENAVITGTNQATNGTAPLIPLQFAVCNLPLFEGTPGVDTVSGTLSFTPFPNAFGNATLEARLYTRIGDVLVASPEFLFFEVTQVNQRPFVHGWTSKVSVLEDAGPFYDSLAVRVSPGWSNELDQEVRFELTVVVHGDNDDPTSLFDTMPTIDRLGNLRFVPRDDAFGLVSYVVAFVDAFGLGVELELEIRVVAVNDPPSFRVVGDDAEEEEEDGGPRNPNTVFTLVESQEAYSRAGFVLQVSPGPANEAEQTVRFEAVRVNTAAGRNVCFRYRLQPADACATLAYLYTGGFFLALYYYVYFIFIVIYILNSWSLRFFF